MKIFRLTREDGIGGWRKLHDEELHDVFIRYLRIYVSFRFSSQTQQKQHQITHIPLCISEFILVIQRRYMFRLMKPSSGDKRLAKPLHFLTSK
jgi:hypothetical protein